MSQDTRTAPSLETFPPEIKILIMSSMPDVESLQALVHASPDYHHAYLTAREDIFHHITLQTLDRNGMNLLDPWTAINAPHLPADVPDRIKIINRFLENYSQGHTDNSRRLRLDDSLAIQSLHRKFTAFIKGFCKVNLTRNPLENSQHQHSVVDQQTPEIPQPSPTELQRIYRAVWRWQIYCKLFGGPEDEGTNDDNTHTPDEISTILLGLFPIHEVEELACLHSYAKRNYEEYIQQPCLDYLVTLGPEFLHRVMKAPSQQEHYEILDANMKSMDPSMRDVLHAYEWVVGGGSWRWKGMDDEPSSRVSVPTDGWVWASSRGIQNTDFKLRRWGYVFWDRQRLDEWGITQERMLNWPWPENLRRVSR